MDLGHKQGLGAPCLKCKEKCSGFELHYWKKICCNCKCGQEEHDIILRNEEERKMERLLEDTKYINLIAKLKLGAAFSDKHNVIIMSNPTDAKKNPSIDTVTYEWAPPVQSQELVKKYMEMLPKEKQPVSGSEGAKYLKKQLVKQLPEHDLSHSDWCEVESQGCFDLHFPDD